MGCVFATLCASLCPCVALCLRVCCECVSVEGKTSEKTKGKKWKHGAQDQGWQKQGNWDLEKSKKKKKEKKRIKDQREDKGINESETTRNNGPEINGSGTFQ